MPPPEKPRKEFKRKTPLKAAKGFERKAGMTVGSGFKPKPTAPADAKKALEKATIKALEKARREAEASGVALSEWESEFIEGVTERVKTYGRAFADPEKGAPGTTLSLRQGLKLKEIRVKTKRAQTRHMKAKVSIE